MAEKKDNLGEGGISHVATASAKFPLVVEKIGKIASITQPELGNSFQNAQEYSSHSTDKKPCAKCKKIKPLSEYHLNRSKKDGRESRCKLCVSQEKARRYKKKEKMRKVSTLFECSVIGELDADSIDEFGQSFALCIEEMIDAGKL